MINNLMHVYAVKSLLFISTLYRQKNESRFPIQNFYLEPVGRNTVIICAFKNWHLINYFNETLFFYFIATVASVPFIIIRHQILVQQSH
jgi:hypothetical protein